MSDPRVLFAAERTLLAWNRSSPALMAFGARGAEIFNYIIALLGIALTAYLFSGIQA